MSARLSVNMNDETAAALRALAQRRGLSITEAVRRVIAVATFIDQEVQQGCTVTVTDPSGQVREMVLL